MLSGNFKGSEIQHGIFLPGGGGGGGGVVVNFWSTNLLDQSFWKWKISLFLKFSLKPTTFEHTIL